MQRPWVPARSNAKSSAFFSKFEKRLEGIRVFPSKGRTHGWGVVCRVCVTTQAVQGFSQAQGGVDDQTASDRAMPHVGFFEFVDAGLGDGGNAGIELGDGVGRDVRWDADG